MPLYRSIIMNNVFKNQAMLQSGYTMLDPAKFGQSASVGIAVDYIREMSFYMSEEVSELIQEISGGNRNALKPWSSAYERERLKSFSSTPHIRSEAIDVLCFAINICLAAGITADTVNEEYNKVLDKNIRRQKNGCY